jgi:hypothetical protein
MQLSNFYSFPNDFFTIDFYNSITLPSGYAELICLFSNDNNVKFTLIKTYRCDWNPAVNGGQLIAFIPEHFSIIPSSTTTLTITARVPVAAGGGNP